jgi:hypothetical protein
MPKLILVGEIASRPGLVLFGGGVVVVAALFELLRPWQPNIVAIARSRTSAFQRAASCLIIDVPVAPPRSTHRGEKVV